MSSISYPKDWFGHALHPFGHERVPLMEPAEELTFVWYYAIKD
jgi:hypothetical protein